MDTVLAMASPELQVDARHQNQVPYLQAQRRTISVNTLSLSFLRSNELVVSYSKCIRLCSEPRSGQRACGWTC